MNLLWDQRVRILDAVDGVEICGQRLFGEIRRVQADIAPLTMNDVVLIQCPKRVDTVIAMIACLGVDKTFKLASEANDTELNQHEATFHYDGTRLKRLRPTATTPILPHVSYVITTSGTTGNKKQVGVPLSCISSNIEFFQTTLDLNANDVILQSTNFEFDPCIIEILMAFRYGCKLIVCTEDYLPYPHLLTKTISRNNVTFLQLTPEVFLMMDIARFLLSEKSTLRFLLLGGSKFPLRTINELRAIGNTTRIFDVYGVTEVSCWATIAEIEHGQPTVRLGTPVPGTELHFTDDMELVLKGKRQCVVDGVLTDPNVGHPTGDIFRTVEGGYEYVGRRDSMVKFRGMRLDLIELEESVNAILAASFVAVNENDRSPTANVFLYREQYLVVVISGGNKKANDYLKDLKTLFSERRLPFRIYHTQTLPVTVNGKLDVVSLTSSLDRGIQGKNDFVEALERLCSYKFEDVLEMSFVDLGFDSFKAALLATYFPIGTFHKVVTMILSRHTIIRDFWTYWRSDFLDSSKLVNPCSYDAKNYVVRIRRQPRQLWACNMVMCVDGDPVLISYDSEMYVGAASHSGEIKIVHHLSGIVLCKLNVITRIEGTVVQIGDRILFGGHDRCLFSLEIRKKKFRLTWKKIVKNVVRAGVTYSGKNYVYVATDNGTLCQIEIETGEFLWEKTVLGGSRAKPTTFTRNDREYVMMTTLHGMLYCFKSDGTLVFRVIVNGPIFHPAIPIDDFCVICSSTGVVQIVIIDPFLPQSISRVRCQNRVDRSLLAGGLVLDGLVYVPTAEGTVLEMELDGLEVRREFIFNLPAVRFNKIPLVINGRTLLLLSNTGYLLRVNLDSTSSTCDAIHVGGWECFSSPVLFRNRYLYVTGRDNLLRCWEYPH
ncbi:unnamed protein product [Caenorhabditis bovis]|uniref:AMP-dependent synthetase/ligase domain-containing protein n=1 Tax=Caenorhabditis bovis TaxID=2654633 RepID=A0A8S1EPR3_9PELO|nr:unnamed protein product [Caenorhabditis bovis]